ncbi:ABC-2 type transport system ATP-binding protein [Lipingzhangella halophila]|uniref:ABC-2 type transport system ATP-binding protein n=1 Tax=Lipingzhangella halophila TaxID=1783352 RepID=A0A7W7RLA0_9ACTN|nr:ABC transporter ATP-binding protein [Lipingzhangella halophila]MBB4934082.1 ABC-2 type transport system ATP-binding protein [Lipingzhangella halophila]
MEPAVAPAVHVSGLEKRYGSVTAVNGIHLTVASGEIFGLLGPNGAGKTTTIECIVGLRRPTSGTVRVLGSDPVAERDQIRPCVAIQPQHSALFELQTVEETLRVWSSLYTDAAGAEEIIDRLGLHDCRRHRVGKLSGGQRQRLLVGLALISRPDLLVLDEPSAGMDPNAREQLWAAVTGHRLAGGTVLLSTHTMEEAHALCDRVAIVDGGRVATYGAPEDLVREHTPERYVTFILRDTGALDEFELWEGVSRVTSRPVRDGTFVQLQSAVPERTMTAVLNASFETRDVALREPSLEEVFRRVTGRDFDEPGARSSTSNASTTSE